jgi:hypothetical protein
MDLVSDGFEVLFLAPFSFEYSEGKKEEPLRWERLFKEWRDQMG